MWGHIHRVDECLRVCSILLDLLCCSQELNMHLLAGLNLLLGLQAALLGVKLDQVESAVSTGLE